MTTLRMLQGDGGAGAVPLRFTDGWRAVHRLRDGTKTRLRLLRPDDRDWVLAGFAQLSAESRYRRFFTAMPRLPETVLAGLLAVDGWNHVAVAAERASRRARPAEPYGVGRFIRSAERPDTAEAAVAVVDHCQGRGLGKLLLGALVAAARERGVTTFRAEVLRVNEAMKGLLRELDESLEPVAVDGAVAVYEIALRDADPEDALPGALLRFLNAAARGLQLFVR